MELEATPTFPHTEMVHAGPAEGQTAALPLERIISHRKLVATIFPRSASEVIPDAPAVTIEDQGEMFHCAASQGMLFSVQTLLADKTFSCDMPDRFGRTPLHWAAEQGHRNVALALLRAGACVDARSQRKFTPVMLAASRGHDDVVETLLHFRASESNCWPLNRHRRGCHDWRSTALHDAAASGHLRLVEALVEGGFDRGQHRDASLTPAEVCVRKSHSTSVAISNLLLPSDMGGERVHDSVNMTMQDVAMVPGRVEGGSFLDWQDKTGNTPLHRAVHFHHAIISRLLLREGANPNLCDHDGASPLHTASSTGNEEIVSDLLEAGADTELLTVGNYSPLRAAVEQNRTNVVELLLDAEASTEHRDAIHDQTALSWACRSCLAPIVCILVEAGADVESRSSAGLTPLHWACRLNDAESVEALLNAGADPCAVDQAAADAVATTSSSSGTIVSMPIAIDVIGLGYPVDRMEDSAMLAARRLDVVTVGRIESALYDAKQERSWHRRGWLVIVASRQADKGARAGVRHDGCAVCRGGCSPFKRVILRTRCGYTLVEHPPCVHQEGATSDAASASTNEDRSNSSDSHHPQEDLSNRQNNVGKWPRTADSVAMIARETPCQKGQKRGDSRTQDSVAALRQDLVSALLGLGAVEMGLFRRVVLFV